MRGRARQKFSLLAPEEKSTFIRAKAAVRSRLEGGSKTLAVQDFRHATQEPQEAVSDYIIRLEKIIRRAYGQDHMAEETRNALLYAQLQEGLKYAIMKAPAVSGAQRYQELCVATRNKERCLNELNRQQQYLRESALEPGTDSQRKRFGLRSSANGNPTQHKLGASTPREAVGNHGATNQRRCYICNSPNHLANKRKASRTECWQAIKRPQQPAARDHSSGQSY